MDLLADTVFLIDLWREAHVEGRATRFAKDHAEQQIGINWIVAGEFLAGAKAANQDVDRVQRFLSRYPLVQSSPSAIHQYAKIYTDLRSRNQLIGTHDLWIAASCRSLDLPVVTRNLDEFQRVSGLKVLGY